MPSTAVTHPALEALELEMKRNWDAFQKMPRPPYYLAYEITEMDTVSVNGSFGTLVSSTRGRTRYLDTDLRVGTMGLDNTHPVRGNPLAILDNFNPVTIPIENDAAALRAAIWYNTDQKYKRSIELLMAVETNVKVKVENTDKAGDFSPAPVEKYLEKPVTLAAIDQKAWEAKVRRYTAPMKRYGNVYQATAVLTGTVETRIFVNSEGSRILTSQPGYRLQVTAFAKASDGMELPRTETWFSATPEGLPSDAVVLAAVEKMGKELQLLKLAPVADPYVGPAILSPRATGVFFHEIFGHRIEAQRMKNENDGQTFKTKVGQKVLPEFLTVYMDPTLKKWGNVELAGHYKYDNQGVKAQRVTVVEKGVLKNFLMSRTPTDEFGSSNGHGRRQPGYVVESRQSNLLVEATGGVSREELKKKLIEEVVKAKLPYGLYFEDVQGGFTMTQRGNPNSFAVIPVMTYRIYPDGREELVRGVDLVGTPLAMFSQITAAGNDPAVFNGMCGATSGMVPVGAGGPSLLVGTIEVQKKPKSQERSPILAPPFDDPALGELRAEWVEFVAGGVN